MKRHTIPTLVLLCFGSFLSAQQKSVTIEGLLSAPFPSELTAAAAKGRVAWVFDIQGRRNIWVAEPTADGDYKARQLTSYSEDDGQEVGELNWSPDAETIVFTRGGDANPQSLPQGVEQGVWAIKHHGGEAKLLGQGHSASVSPKGESVAYISKGQVWLASLNGSGKAAQLIHAKGEASNLRWSPDGSKLAFESQRGDHGFIGVYDFAAKSLVYLDASVDRDQQAVWSPDGRQIAFIRIPVEKGQIPFFTPQGEGEPWSIRIGDPVTGKGHEIWRAKVGRGSVFHEAVSDNQLLWSAGDQIVFPWERDGWTHLYCISMRGGRRSSSRPEILRSMLWPSTPTVRRSSFLQIRTMPTADTFGEFRPGQIILRR
jgi:Tol biopolymer transport system component